MLGSYEGAMVDTAAETVVPQLGCRTLCQHPGCLQPIEVVEGTQGPTWVHRLHAQGVRRHKPTPVEQPEPSPGERLVASVEASLRAHQRGRQEGFRAGYRQAESDAAAWDVLSDADKRAAMEADR